MSLSGMGKRGFTVVEIIVVIAIFGILMTAVYSLYLTHQRSAFTQEDIIEVQQNLRSAMDTITRDLRMAGILVPQGTNPLASGSPTSLQINTASAGGHFARVTQDVVTTGLDNFFSTNVDSPESVDGLVGTGVVNVRLIRPIDKSNPVGATSTYLILKSTTRSGPSVEVQKPGVGNFPAGISINKGDVIAMTGPPVPPTTAPPAGFDSIVYSLTACSDSPTLSCLARTVNQATPEIIASNIKSINFSYLYDDGSEDSIFPTDPTTIRGVRVTITGETAATALLSGGPKTRQMTSIIKLRNKR